MQKLYILMKNTLKERIMSFPKQHSTYFIEIALSK